MNQSAFFACFVAYAWMSACSNDNSQESTILAAPVQQKISSCSFQDRQFPANLLVLAGGSYSGRRTSRQIDDSGHEATVMDVVVNVPDTPVALMLGSHEPTIWNISRTPETRITAIVLSGYYTQVLTGVSPDVPVLNSTFHNKGPCDLFYLADDGMENLQSLAQQLFGRPLTQKYFATEGQLVIGQPVSSGMNLVADPSAAIESFYTPGAPPAATAGIREALERGVLRRATMGDALEWERAFRRHLQLEAGSAPPMPSVHGNKSDMLDNAFIVLKPFVFPSGLYGEAATTFFVPRGVPFPTGKPGHSTVNDYNQLRQ